MGSTHEEQRADIEAFQALDRRRDALARLCAESLLEGGAGSDRALWYASKYAGVAAAMKQTLARWAAESDADAIRNGEV